MPKRAEGAWVHAIVARHWGPLLALAGAPERMPTAQEPAPGRRGAPRRIALHGCGHYGCVAPTGDPGVVFKLTSDPDEAGFVAAALAKPIESEGVVAYYAVAELPERRSGRPVYALWREAAREVGSAMAPWGETGTAFDTLRRFNIAAAALRNGARRSDDPAGFVRAALSRAETEHRHLSWWEIEDVRRLSARLRALRGVARGALGYAAAEMHAVALAHREVSGEIGSALVEWMRRGILLCDVHHKNVGKAKRSGRDSLVITDPGHALLLDDSHAGLRVPDLREAGQIGWRDVGRRDNPGSMTEDELMDIFLEERAKFAERYPSVAEASLEVSEAACNSEAKSCSKRDVASCSWWGRGRKKTRQRVTFVRRALALPRRNIVAIMRHEFGHLSDPRAGDPGPGSEARADRIAEDVGGELINYDRGDLQTTGPGRRRRPAHLHQ